MRRELSNSSVLTVGSMPQLGCASLLLEVGVPFRVVAGDVHLEVQAHHGVRQWMQNFDHLTLCAVSVPEKHVESTMQWTSGAQLFTSGRFSAVLLPWAYKPASHLSHVTAVREALRLLISNHRYLCFSGLGWLGAWGRIACEEAYALHRPFAVWLDWVLHEMPVRREPMLVKRIWRKVQARMLRRLSFRDVQRASLGLFNGQTVFDAYSRLCKVPRVVYDVHLGVEDVIQSDQLRTRIERRTGAFQVIYVGRVHEMKGPRHWLDALEIALQRSAGRVVKASWIGDGPLLEEMRNAVDLRRLSGRVSFSGPEANRSRLLAMMREADVFLFCHLTPESPRCLIEALMSGLPLVGFSSSYASGLLGKDREGGSFVAVGDSAALAHALLDCVQDKQRLIRMTEAAYSAGRGYSDVAVFKQRSDLIKEFL